MRADWIYVPNGRGNIIPFRAHPACAGSAGNLSALAETGKRESDAVAVKRRATQSGDGSHYFGAPISILKIPVGQLIRVNNKPSKANGSLLFLDGLRGLAAFYVMVGHARWLLWEGYS